MSHRVVALTIAASDSGGGAGVVADVKTFEAHGVWAAVALTAVTAQNTVGVDRWSDVPIGVVRDQIQAVTSDLRVAAAKTGAIGGPDMIEAVAAAVTDFGVAPLVVDPVLQATTGEELAPPDSAAAMVASLLPRCTVITPNLAEAAALTGGTVQTRRDMEAAGHELIARGARAVLVTGGHLDGAAGDCLVRSGLPPLWLEGERLLTTTTHGTGCVLSAAITANLARGKELELACRSAKYFVARALAAGVSLGAGAGAVDPGWRAGFR